MIGWMKTIGNPTWTIDYRLRCKKGKLWFGCFFLKPCNRMLTEQLFTVVCLLASVGNRYKIDTTKKKKGPKGRGNAGTVKL